MLDNTDPDPRNQNRPVPQCANLLKPSEKEQGEVGILSSVGILKPSEKEQGEVGVSIVILHLYLRDETRHVECSKCGSPPVSAPRSACVLRT